MTNLYSEGWTRQYVVSLQSCVMSSHVKSFYTKTRCFISAHLADYNSINLSKILNAVTRMNTLPLGRRYHSLCHDTPIRKPRIHKRVHLLQTIKSQRRLLAKNAPCPFFYDLFRKNVRFYMATFTKQQVQQQTIQDDDVQRKKVKTRCGVVLSDDVYNIQCVHNNTAWQMAFYGLRHRDVVSEYGLLCRDTSLRLYRNVRSLFPRRKLSWT